MAVVTRWRLGEVVAVGRLEGSSRRVCLWWDSFIGLWLIGWRLLHGVTIIFEITIFPSKAGLMLTAFRGELLRCRHVRYSVGLRLGER